MKRFLLIFSLVFTSMTGLFAQVDDPDDKNERIQDKMNEFIQRQLKLSPEESKKFSPVFLSYFKEWRRTLRENKNDPLVRQQKVVDLQLRYRTQFREIIGEDRGNQVFAYQKLFIKELYDIQKKKRNTNVRQ